MIDRRLLPEVLAALDEAPAACLLGARQVGKTTLALAIARKRDALYLDLESPRDRARLDDPEGYLERHLDKLVILDEVHRTPGLFPPLRGLIDRARRRGLRAGRYLLLGSASLSLLRQAGESLAGRVRFLELAPLDLLEAAAIPPDRLWLRGGFPESVLAPSDERSLRWREDFIRTYLERDIPQFGPRLPSETLRRFWVMLAHRQGNPYNASELARNLGLDTRTVNRYVDLLVDLFLARRLPPWHANIGKRLVKSPRLYVRDCGLVHALLGIEALDGLLEHPVVGASWEGFVIENLLVVAPEGTQAYYYRTSGGAEIDLLLELPRGVRWAVEVKRSSAPVATRGFYEACSDVRPKRRFVVYPGTERFPLAGGVEAVPLSALAAELAAMRKRP
ncbi:ATP-binding protein [Pelomicrobium methylotrophicum]|uniref:ATP-binding protein n=1 Tax=Pelomicrobium methylotrophicum TaxID=2602750 RepID=A0A5C7EF45_9PROT|nr:ATP-binding protein [Pelomicrobium methylotrophicum]TXF10501.1 ATP-binding protein [Pelomicrobium methylotrophicum]